MKAKLLKRQSEWDYKKNLVWKVMKRTNFRLL